jgi:carboxymethylenebutenolidase
VPASFVRRRAPAGRKEPDRAAAVPVRQAPRYGSEMTYPLESLVLGGLTRRRFVVTSLAAGFAAATLPIRSEGVITTPAEGLLAGEVKIPTSDGVIPGYRAQPVSGAPFPVAIVVQEIFGVHEHIRDVCRRLAKAGYLAIAPELYARQGDVSKLTDIQQIVTGVVMKVPDAQVMADLDATVAWAEQTHAGDVSRLAITGFCWGGRIVWLYAAHSAKLRAGVAWYGRLASASDPLHPKQPIDLAASLRAPVLGLYGGADDGIPQADVDRMKAAITAAGGASEIVVYPGAPHGFHADYRPSYRETEAKDGWQRLLAWFAKHGAA